MAQPHCPGLPRRGRKPRMAEIVFSHNGNSMRVCVEKKENKFLQELEKQFRSKNAGKNYLPSDFVRFVLKHPSIDNPRRVTYHTVRTRAVN